MGNVLNLKEKAVPAPEVPAPAPLPAIPHPIIQEQKILTDTGTDVPYPSLRWQAPRAYRQEGNLGAHILAVLLVIGGLVMGIFFQEVVTAILLVLLGIMTVVHVQRHIPAVAVEVTPLKILAGTASYSYDDLESFWVHYEPEHDIRELSLHMKKWHWPYVKIQLADADPVQVRAILLEYIPEVKHEETLIHSIVRKLGM